MLGLSLALGLLLGAPLGLVGCDDNDEIGTPCESNDECSGELICDVHDGKGTCQEDHGHLVPEQDGHDPGPADVIVEP
ncbi:hypothetical protein ENSA5_32950 [Enhygromyxa salina]|uniref:Uncharacterized protein n=2 Tax=Enhygromyxa salina TaxID=215803 RepID=A0A2S9XXM0_9BACT|nr:hypothetical protein ENSA5_32950 [Enhygromyxa salina]